MVVMLAECQLAILAENAVKFELKLSNKNGEETKQKRGGSGVGDNKNDTECGKCKLKLNPDVKSCGEVKNVNGN